MSSRYQRGSLRKEGDRWILRRRIDGKESRLVVGMIADFKTEGAARKEADAKLEAMNAGARQAGERITLRAFAPIFLEDICARKKPSTRSAYSSAFAQHLLPLFGSKALSDIRNREFTHLAAELGRRSRAPSTVRAVCVVLQTALHKAIDNGYAAHRVNLAFLHLGAARSVQAKRRIFTKDQVSGIIEAAGYPWRALYALLAYAGLRCGEALGLDWDAIDYEAKQITLRQAASMGQIQSTKSRASEAPIPMADELAEELRRYRTHYDDVRNGELPLIEEKLLFPSSHDPRNPYWSSGVRKQHFKPLLKRLGIAPAGLHAFRHSFCTELIRQGTALNVVKELARHSDIRVTMTYVHTTREDQVSAVDDYGKSLKRVGT